MSVNFSFRMIEADKHAFLTIKAGNEIVTLSDVLHVKRSRDFLLYISGKSIRGILFCNGG